MAAEQQIVFTSADARYMPGALVSLYTALQNTRARTFIVVTSAPDSEWLSPGIYDLFEERGARLLVVESSSLPLHTMLGATQRFPAEAFARFFADALPVGEASRALYIDSDVMVMGNIDSLLDYDLGDCCLGAAPDIHAIAKGKLLKQQQRIGLSTNDVYLGSGVLLIDLAQYQRSTLRDQISSTLTERAGQLIYPDQDALNLADRTQIKVLNPCHNFPPGLWRFLGPAERASITILHFYDGNKPWGDRAHRVPVDLLDRYDNTAELLGLSEAISNGRPTPLQTHSQAYAQKYWLENIFRRPQARRAISQWLGA
ncbi:MAG: glycosyltransferase [Pseudomonadota bacterium]